MPSFLAIHKLYDTLYQNNVMEIALQALSAKKQEKEDIFTAFLNQDIQSSDEFEAYVNRTPAAASDDLNPIRWWANTGSPQLMNMAFDLLSISAMNSEKERVFSGAKLLLPSRDRLSEDIIEATGCLNRWYKAGLRLQ